MKFETPYAISKYIGERYVNFFHEYYGLPTVILRIFNSFGPGERSGLYRNVIPKFFYQAIKKQDLIITGTGAETRNFTFVDDIVRGAILAAIKKAANGHIINLGGSREISVLELAKKINKLTNNHKKIIFKPRRKWDDTLSRKADLRLAKKLLGYKAEISFEGGLGKTHEWILNQIKINKI